jgi:hypothetical protein
MSLLFELQLVADRRQDLQRLADATHLRREAKQHRRHKRRR